MRILFGSFCDADDVENAMEGLTSPNWREISSGVETGFEGVTTTPMESSAR